MSYQYPSGMSGLQAPPPAGSSLPPGMQSGLVDAAGYNIKPQSTMTGMGTYPMQAGLSTGAAFPPMPPGVGAGYPADSYGASPTAAYPPPPAGSSLPGMGGGSAFGGFNTSDLYAHAQQYGMNRGEVDAALQTYQEMSNMDRSLLTSLGSGTLQNLLRRIFSQSSGTGGTNDQLISSLIRILSNTLSTGRLPNVKEFLTLLGSNKMQYGGQGGKYGVGQGAMGTGVGQQYPQAGMGMGMGQQQYPPGGMGMGQQQYPPGGMGMGGGMPPY